VLQPTTCPGCAETYRRDAYQLIRAGLVGGKGIAPAVATHPALFVTFTAPSFGPVHARQVRQHTCADKTRCTCQPQPCHARRDAATCEHGRPAACFTRHRRDDARLGQPLCPDCYDYPAHVVWNNQAGELWRRTKQAIERHLNQAARHRGLATQVRVAHGKATEYQARGSVHFHALLRLDGYDPGDPNRLLPPPPGITIADLDEATRWAADAISYRTPHHPLSPAAGPSPGAPKSTSAPSPCTAPAPSLTWRSPATSLNTPLRAPNPPVTPPPALPPRRSTFTPTRVAPILNGS
jgi:hypothetical protein